MKGHVGGGSGFWRLLGVGYSVKASHYSQCPYTPCKICAGMAPGNERFYLGNIPPGIGSDIKLESLILAQNERWRHA